MIEKSPDDGLFTAYNDSPYYVGPYSTSVPLYIVTASELIKGKTLLIVDNRRKFFSVTPIDMKRLRALAEYTTSNAEVASSEEGMEYMRVSEWLNPSIYRPTRI